ncbi:MAG: alpha/beta fold hydrolase [Bdellovibrionales bacterium]
MKQIIPPLVLIYSALAPHLTAHLAQGLFLKPKRYPLSAKEQALIAKSKKEVLQSGRVAYLWGDETQPTIALLHGWESRAAAFFKWVPLLVESGFSVLGWDAPAHGQSPGSRTTAPEMARAFADDLHELGLSLHGIIGHSMGGVVAGLLPRYNIQTPYITIVSSPSHIRGVFERYHDQIRLQKRARKIFQQSLEKRTGIDIEKGSLVNNDLSLKSKVLVIHDLEDREVPFSDFQELQKTWSKAQFVATHGLGHRRILRDEAVGYQIADFFKSAISI